MTPPGEFPNNSAQPHLALWLDSPVVQSGLALRLDLRDLRKAHFLKPIRNGFRPRVYLVLAYARHSTVASPLGPAAAGPFDHANCRGAAPHAASRARSDSAIRNIPRSTPADPSTVPLRHRDSEYYSRERSIPFATGLHWLRPGDFPGAFASADPRPADSLATSQRRSMERRVP